nr:uncharacterized protein LOC128681484 [Plodia interpunctella]
MAPKILFLFIIQALIFKVFSSQVQPTPKQYIITMPQSQLSSLQSVVPSPTKPTNNLSALASLASILSSGSSNSLPSLVTTGSPSQSLSSLLTTATASSSLPSLMAATPTNHVTPPVSMPTPEKPQSSSVDMELLNNLAIALQLMIVNNILSTSPAETPPPSPETTQSVPSFESVENLSYAPIQNDLPTIANQYQNYQPNYEQQSFNHMPNANFVGSAGFADTNPFMGTVPPPSPSRSGLTLMSPYEALSPNSPYLDPILSSPYGSVMSSKKDFQSPYATILGSDKDYFSMSSINDLF